MYEEVRDKYLSDEENAPSKSCWAISRYVACIDRFPKCIDEEKTEYSICEWVCDEIWDDRCPDVNICYIYIYILL